jgi:hypothetical protein
VRLQKPLKIMSFGANLTVTALITGQQPFTVNLPPSTPNSSVWQCHPLLFSWFICKLVGCGEMWWDGLKLPNPDVVTLLVSVQILPA